MCLWQQSDDGTQFFLAPLFYYIETKRNCCWSPSPASDESRPRISAADPVTFSVLLLVVVSEAKRREENLKMPVWLMGDGWWWWQCHEYCTNTTSTTVVVVVSRMCRSSSSFLMMWWSMMSSRFQHDWPETPIQTPSYVYFIVLFVLFLAMNLVGRHKLGHQPTIPLWVKPERWAFTVIRTW